MTAECEGQESPSWAVELQVQRPCGRWKCGTLNVEKGGQCGRNVAGKGKGVTR